MPPAVSTGSPPVYRPNAPAVNRTNAAAQLAYHPPAAQGFSSPIQRGLAQKAVGAALETRPAPAVYRPQLPQSHLPRSLDPMRGRIAGTPSAITPRVAAPPAPRILQSPQPIRIPNQGRSANSIQRYYDFLDIGSKTPERRNAQNPTPEEPPFELELRPVSRAFLNLGSDGDVWLKKADERSKSWMQEKRKLAKTGAFLTPMDITLSTDPRSTQTGRQDQETFLKEISQKIKPWSNKEVHRYTTWVSSGLLSGFDGKQSNAENFQGQFELAVKRAEHIHVNLDSVPETDSYIKNFNSGGQFLAIAGNSGKKVTADELFVLSQNQAIIKKTSFYVSGKKLSRRTAFQDPIDQTSRLKAKSAAKTWKQSEETDTFRDRVEFLLGGALSRLEKAFGKEEAYLIRAEAASVRDMARDFGFQNIAQLAERIRTADDFSFQTGSAGKANLQKQPTPEQISRGETKALRLLGKIQAEYLRLLLLIEDLQLEA